jgi:hypothetical protein
MFWIVRPISFEATMSLGSWATKVGRRLLSRVAGGPDLTVKSYVVGVGGFLGIGTKYVSVARNALTVSGVYFAVPGAGLVLPVAGLGSGLGAAASFLASCCDR